MTSKHGSPTDKKSGPKSGAGGSSGKGAAHDTHHARKRRVRRDAAKAARGDSEPADAQNRLFIYGQHAVRHALENPQRIKHVLHATPNALARLTEKAGPPAGLRVEEATPRVLAVMTGPDAVHQGLVLETEPLAAKRLDELPEANLLLALDQVTDPHNVGAILRSAVAFGAGAVVTTARHSPSETGVLAKAASGALDMIDMLAARNLAAALDEIAAAGFTVIGLDSAGEKHLEEAAGVAARQSGKIALVLGAEGKGLRAKTRDHCTALARLDMPGRIASLNVSNAAALSLYVASRALEPAG